MLTRWNSDGPHVWDKPGLSGYLVCLVHLVSLLQPNKLDRPNRPNEQDRWMCHDLYRFSTERES